MIESQYRKVRFLLARILRVCKYRVFSTALMSLLSRILQALYHLYRVHRTRFQKANLPMMVPLDPNSAEYLEICSELAEQVHEETLGMPLGLVRKIPIAHLEMSMSIPPNSCPADRQSLHTLVPAAVLWRYLKQSGLSEQGSQRSSEIIHMIDSLYANSQMRAEPSGASLCDNDATPARQALLRAQEQDKQVCQQPKTLSCQEPRSAQTVSQDEEAVNQKRTEPLIRCCCVAVESCYTPFTRGGR